MVLTSCLIVLSSLILMYQGVAIRNIGIIERFEISNLSNNMLCYLVGIRLSLWGIFLGALGLFFIILILVDSKISSDSGDTSTSISVKTLRFVSITYILLALATFL